MNNLSKGKNAFTMIELIFVIVILGILAAVAVPKLTATRTDATISKMSSNIKTVISDVTTTFISAGELTTWDEATNVQLMTDPDTTISGTDVTTAVYIYNGTKQCIKFIVTTDGNLTVSKGSDTTDTVCKSVQTKQANVFNSILLGGSRIKY